MILSSLRTKETGRAKCPQGKRLKCRKCQVVTFAALSAAFNTNLPDMKEPSKSAIRKAGSRIREEVERGTSLEQIKVSSYMDIIKNYRSCFNEPMQKVAEQLRVLLSESHLTGQVSSRLKRAETIIDKLSKRETGLDLSRMQDIGGCRVVLDDPGIRPVRELERMVLSKWNGQVVLHRDYYSSPRRSGYRSIHVVVRELDMPIEIQLRSQLAHSFAQTVEAISQMHGVNYKQDGDSPVHLLLAELADRLALLESGGLLEAGTFESHITDIEALVASIVDHLGR